MNNTDQFFLFEIINEVSKYFVHSWVASDFTYACYTKPPEPAAFVKVRCDLQGDSGYKISTIDGDEERFENIYLTTDSL